MSDKDDPTIFEMFQAAPPGSVLLVQRVMLEDMQQTMDALRAENERLRAALEWVRDNTELWDAPIVLDALAND